MFRALRLTRAISQARQVSQAKPALRTARLITPNLARSNPVICSAVYFSKAIDYNDYYPMRYTFPEYRNLNPDEVPKTISTSHTVEPVTPSPLVKSDTNTDTDSDTSDKTILVNGVDIDNYIYYTPNELRRIFFDDGVNTICIDAIKQNKIAVRQHKNKQMYDVVTESGDSYQMFGALIHELYDLDNERDPDAQHSERYKLMREMFFETYDVEYFDEMHKAEYRGLIPNYTSKPFKVKAIEVLYNIKFKAPWNEMQYLNPGDYLIRREICDQIEIYGVTQDVFDRSYKIVLDESHD